jgi:hypothetical protein
MSTPDPAVGNQRSYINCFKCVHYVKVASVTLTLCSFPYINPEVNDCKDFYNQIICPYEFRINILCICAKVTDTPMRYR